MATTNLSYYDKATIPNAKSFRFGIVVSEWNHTITNGLLEGAIAALKENGAKEEHIIVKHMPGSFELALGAQYLLEHLQIDGIIALGSVVQGETKHFDFVCKGTTEPSVMNVGSCSSNHLITNSKVSKEYLRNSLSSGTCVKSTLSISVVEIIAYTLGKCAIVLFFYLFVFMLVRQLQN